MKTLVSFFFLLGAIGTVRAQAFNGDTYSDASLFLGYGKLGVNIRLDLEIARKYIKESSTRLYLEGGGQSIEFEQKNFSFIGTLYPSDCRILSFGIGIAQEIGIGSRCSMTPFVGLRNEYVRFKSQALADAIGSNGLQRWADTTYTKPLGPPVDNAYGDASACDIGCRIGVAIGKRVGLAVTGAYSNIDFDTGSTLFGQYLGEAPYKNPYWVKRQPLRLEGALRIGF